MDLNEPLHGYIFSDACPTDWLRSNHDETWHTLVNLSLAVPRTMKPYMAEGRSHIEILEAFPGYANYIKNFEEKLRTKKLKKWSNSPGYQASFQEVFSKAKNPVVCALSFQEKTLRNAKDALLNAYNQMIGGVEGRGIGFTETLDSRGRIWMQHSFLTMNGLYSIEGLQNQMLVLLLMSWFIAQQYLVLSGISQGNHTEGFAITVVSDKLSGDDDVRRRSETNLRLLIDPDRGGDPITLTRSPRSDSFSADLLVDNLAGWLNAIVSGRVDDARLKRARMLVPTRVRKSWYELAPTEGRLLTLVEPRLFGNP